jgi:hypothetical protein
MGRLERFTSLTFSVLYDRIPELFAALALARGDGRHAKLLRSIGRAKLLILDDWGPEKLSPEQARDLLEIVRVPARCRPRPQLLMNTASTAQQTQLIIPLTRSDAARWPTSDRKPRPASDRNRWPASYWNAWPASSESAARALYPTVRGMDSRQAQRMLCTNKFVLCVPYPTQHNTRPREGANPKRGGGAVDRVTAWIDAKPHRFKLILLAHTVVVAGAIVFVSTLY